MNFTFCCGNTCLCNGTAKINFPFGTICPKWKIKKSQNLGTLQYFVLVTMVFI